MTRDAWRDAILDAVARSERGEPDLLELMATLLAEQDAAKSRLSAIGFGCVGRPWLDVVADVEEFVTLMTS